jgi:hypothetical protein
VRPLPAERPVSLEPKAYQLGREQLTKGHGIHRVELAASHVWGSVHQFALSFSAEAPLSRDSLQWKSLTGFAWYF